MTGIDGDKILRALAMLQSLRSNLSNMGSIPATYVQEYHAVLDKIESLGMNTSDYRIPDSEVRPELRQQTFGKLGRQDHYSREKYVRGTFMLTKMDALLDYLKLIMPDKSNKTGFPTPEKE